MREKTAFVVVLVLTIILIAFIGWRNQENNTNFCTDADHEGFLADPTGKYCFDWVDGRKVLTPIKLIEEGR